MWSIESSNAWQSEEIIPWIKEHMIWFASWLYLNETIYIKNAHCHINMIFFLFLVSAPNMHKLIFIFSTLWVMLALIPINYKYPTFHMIRQNKIFPTLGNHSVIWLTWKHFGQCSKTLNHFFSCQTKLFVSKMNLIQTSLLKFTSNNIN